MKPISFAAAVFIGLSLATPVIADKGGSCHFHGQVAAQEATVLKCASQRKDSLASAGKIEASWKAVTHEKVEQVQGKKGQEWKVTYRHPTAAEKDKQVLYVFLSLPGNVLAANFTGR